MRTYVNLGRITHLECVASGRACEHCIVRVAGTRGGLEFDTCVVLADRAFRVGKAALWDVRLECLLVKWANPELCYKAGERIELPSDREAFEFARNNVRVDPEDDSLLRDLQGEANWVDADGDPAPSPPDFRASLALWLLYGVQNAFRRGKPALREDGALREEDRVKFVLDAYAGSPGVGYVDAAGFRALNAFRRRTRDVQERYNRSLSDPRKADRAAMRAECLEILGCDAFRSSCGNDFAEAIARALREVVDGIDSGARRPVAPVEPYSAARYPETGVLP